MTAGEGERPGEVPAWLPPRPDGAPAVGQTGAGVGQPPAAVGPPPGPPPQYPPPVWGPAYEPGNKPANLGFALSISAAAVLLVSFGVLGPVSLPMAIAGWVQGRKGVGMVERGETRKHESTARAAVIIGTLTAVLSAIAVIVFALVLITDPGAFDDSSGER
jgi:hypothetical protein